MNYCLKNETWNGQGGRSEKPQKLILVGHSEFAKNIDQGLQWLTPMFYLYKIFLKGHCVSFL